MKYLQLSLPPWLSARISRLQAQWRQPGRHWFLLLYLLGLAAVTGAAMLLKMGMKLL